jgi:hypothetical protein
MPIIHNHSSASGSMDVDMPSVMSVEKQGSANDTNNDDNDTKLDDSDHH